MSKLTDTQLVILSAASQRDDRGVELPANIRGEAARKVVDKLIRADLLEEVRAGGSLPVWRRDDGSGPMALRITKNGLEAIDVEDETTAGSKEPSVRHSHNSEVENSAPNAIASRKRISVATQKSTRKKHHPGKAKTKASSRRDSRPGSKQWFAKSSASTSTRRKSTVSGSIASSKTAVLVPIPAVRIVAPLERHAARGDRSGGAG